MVTKLACFDVAPERKVFNAKFLTQSCIILSLAVSLATLHAVMSQSLFLQRQLAIQALDDYKAVLVTLRTVRRRI